MKLLHVGGCNSGKLLEVRDYVNLGDTIVQAVRPLRQLSLLEHVHPMNIVCSYKLETYVVQKWNYKYPHGKGHWWILICVYSDYEFTSEDMWCLWCKHRKLFSFKKTKYR